MWWFLRAPSAFGCGMGRGSWRDLSRPRNRTRRRVEPADVMRVNVDLGGVRGMSAAYAGSLSGMQEDNPTRMPAFPRLPSLLRPPRTVRDPFFDGVLSSAGAGTANDLDPDALLDAIESHGHSGPARLSPHSHSHTHPWTLYLRMANAHLDTGDVQCSLTANHLRELLTFLTLPRTALADGPSLTLDRVRRLLRDMGENSAQSVPGQLALGPFEWDRLFVAYDLAARTDRVHEILGDVERLVRLCLTRVDPELAQELVSVGTARPSPARLAHIHKHRTCSGDSSDTEVEPAGTGPDTNVDVETAFPPAFARWRDPSFPYASQVAYPHALLVFHLSRLPLSSSLIYPVRALENHLVRRPVLWMTCVRHIPFLDALVTVRSRIAQCDPVQLRQRWGMALHRHAKGGGHPPTHVTAAALVGLAAAGEKDASAEVLASPAGGVLRNMARAGDGRALSVAAVAHAAAGRRRDLDELLSGIRRRDRGSTGIPGYGPSSRLTPCAAAALSAHYARYNITTADSLVALISHPSLPRPPSWPSELVALGAARCELSVAYPTPTDTRIPANEATSEALGTHKTPRGLSALAEAHAREAVRVLGDGGGTYSENEARDLLERAEGYLRSARRGDGVWTDGGWVDLLAARYVVEGWGAAGEQGRAREVVRWIEGLYRVGILAGRGCYRPIGGVDGVQVDKLRGWVEGWGEGASAMELDVEVRPRM